MIGIQRNKGRRDHRQQPPPPAARGGKSFDEFVRKDIIV
jgi:hypothetical protein